jgi:SpoVK/Ycf46/Vps4 family AAA+-type ATPase
MNEQKTITNNQSILNQIKKIDLVVNQQGMNSKSLRLVKSENICLSEYLGVDKELSPLFAIVLVAEINEQAPDILQISKRIGMEVIDFLPNLDKLELLLQKGLLRKKKSRRRFADESLKNKVYQVNEEVMYNIVRNLPLPKLEVSDSFGSIEILQQINDWLNQASDDELNSFELKTDVSKLLEENKKHFVANHIWTMDFSIEYKIVFSHIIWKSLTGCKSVDLDYPCDAVSSNTASRLRMIQEIALGEDPLTKGDWIATKEGKFSSELEATLTEKAIQLLEEENIQIKEQKFNRFETIKPDSIIDKSLFFNENEQEQWSRIHSLLDEENFKLIHDRMSQKGMRTGFTILFHGAPGTGKTESVLQLAKLTGREIMKIDVAMTKSMWFGESEKIMKRIFNNYEQLRQKSSITPILFFNEADAILGKRKVNSDSNVAQTENAIQNILLEALENFKGIFIATTNLIQNLDTAFDRRFIYKMCFMPPSIETGAQIWKQNLPFLTEENCMNLAESFQFSGGQIDNVVRKCEIEHILSGRQANAQEVFAFCEREELLKNNGSRIGF